MTGCPYAPASGKGCVPRSGDNLARCLFPADHAFKRSVLEGTRGRFYLLTLTSHDGTNEPRLAAMIGTGELHELLAMHDPYVRPGKVEELAASFTRRTYRKGEVIISGKGTCTTCVFLAEGFVHAFRTVRGEVQTMWFGEKGDLLTSYHTLFKNEPGDETVVALTDCEVYSIDMVEFKRLVATDLEVAAIYIKVLEAGYSFWENRFLIRIQLAAEERYAEWLTRTKHLAQHIPLGILARYLGIDQATLSRIRAKGGNKGPEG